MAWEVKDGRRYYYRCLRQGKRIRHLYLGKGPEAERAAAEDRQRQEERQRAWEARRADNALHQHATAPLLQLTNLTELMTQTALVGAGFHRQDRSPWRKRQQHGQQSTPEPSTG
jgi:hypothetical protein